MYAAHDDFSIYGIGNTAAEALEDATRIADGDYRVSKIEPTFAAKIEQDGFNSNHDSFDVDENGMIVECSDD